MGRRRVADQDQLLDAAERVVRRDGAARLTLDAVAAEAGISKASVLYAFRSKRTLVEAAARRRVARARSRIARLRACRDAEPDGAVRARVALAAEEITEGDREIVIALHAALAGDRALLAPVEEMLRGWMGDVAGASRSPRGALLAFLAAEGLQSLERFGLMRFEPAERERILDEITWLAGQAPERVPHPAPAPQAGDGDPT